MTVAHQALCDRLKKQFPNARSCLIEFAEVTLEVAAQDIQAVCMKLRDEPELQFEELIDLCGVDYLTYGSVEWDTLTATGSGFSRGFQRADAGSFTQSDESLCPAERRFAVTYHLLSISLNQRLRLKVFLPGENPIIDSVVSIWNNADWYEREAFDLFGILFNGHPDLRRILTDYGFIGHPFRKDFPLIGHVEMRYDAEKQRVIYEPVSIDPRTLVPKVKRDDHRYLSDIVSDMSEGDV